MRLYFAAAVVIAALLAPIGTSLAAAAAPSVGPASQAAGEADPSPAVDIFSDIPPARGGPAATDAQRSHSPSGHGDPRWGTGLLMRGIFSLALVLLLILAAGRAARYFTQRALGRSGGDANAMSPARVLQRLSLSPRHALAWVESGSGQIFLVGFGDGGMSMLGPLPAVAPAPSSATGGPASAHFSSALADARANIAHGQTAAGHSSNPGQP